MAMKNDSTINNEEVQVEITIEQIMYVIEKFSFDELTQLSTFIEEKLDYLKKNEVEEIEKQMRELQSKLQMLKGNEHVVECSPEKPKYKNPATGEIAGTRGKKPAWLLALLAPARGNKEKEKVILESLKV